MHPIEQPAQAEVTEAQGDPKSLQLRASFEDGFLNGISSVGCWIHLFPGSESQT